MAAMMELFGDASGMSYRVDLVRPTGDKPYAVLGRQRVGLMTSNTLEQPPSSRTVRRFVPVSGDIAGIADPETRRAEASRIAEDTLHQFGVTDVPYL